MEVYSRYGNAFTLKPSRIHAIPPCEIDNSIWRSEISARNLFEAGN